MPPTTSLLRLILIVGLLFLIVLTVFALLPPAELRLNSNKSMPEHEATIVRGIDSRQLENHLPDVPAGWTSEVVGTLEYNYTNGGSFTSLAKTYSLADEPKVLIEITDTAYHEVGPLPHPGNLREYQNEKGYGRWATVSGFPAYEMLEKGIDADTYRIFVYVGERFVIEVVAGDLDTLHQFATQVDYYALENPA